MALLFPATKAFRLGGFTVDPSRNLIASESGETTVEPKVMEVLCYLCAHAGEVVARNAIIDAVWGVAYGGDESLTRAISLLRKALTDDAIRTIPKRGYSLALEPGEVTDAPQTARPRRRWWPWLAGAAVVILAVAGIALFYRPQPPVSRINGIIVLVKPLASDTGGVQADSLTASLARFDQIKVRRFQAGAPPDTRTAYVYVVAGALSQDGGRGRMTVQLQDYASGDTLWSGGETYDAGAPDRAVSALSAELEPAILKAAKAEVQKKPAITLSPWELILLGTWVPGADQEWQGPPTENSYWVWERAIAKDPGFALAHASLAQVMANFALFDPPSDTADHTARAAQSADRALQLAPYDAGVLFQIALYQRYAGRRSEAAATLQRVLDLEPDNVMARIELDYVDGQCSAHSEAAGARLKALDATLPPSSPARWVILSHLADMALARGDYAAARDNAARSRQIVRQVWSSITLAAADAELGDARQAAEVGNEHRKQWPALDYGRFADGNLSKWCLGGDTAKARDAFVKLGRAVSEQP